MDAGKRKILSVVWLVLVQAAAAFLLFFVWTVTCIIVLDMDNIMCYITIPNNGGWHDKKNPRCQEYLSKAQRRVA